jgi:hypothetical protein
MRADRPRLGDSFARLCREAGGEVEEALRRASLTPWSLSLANLMDFTPEGRRNTPTRPQNYRSEFLEKHYQKK